MEVFVDEEFWFVSIRFIDDRSRGIDDCDDDDDDDDDVADALSVYCLYVCVEDWDLVYCEILDVPNLDDGLIKCTYTIPAKIPDKWPRKDAWGFTKDINTNSIQATIRLGTWNP